MDNLWIKPVERDAPVTDGTFAAGQAKVGEVISLIFCEKSKSLPTILAGRRYAEHAVHL